MEPINGARLVVEIAPSCGVLGDPDPGDWVDISDRVLDFAMDRGRQDELGTFEAGTVTLELVNDDQMLNPFLSGSLVEAAAGLGLPLSPLRVQVDYKGQTWPLFYGGLSEEPWQPTRAPHGVAASVRVSAVDRLGVWSQVQLPATLMDCAITALVPDWWARSVPAGAAHGDPIPDDSVYRRPGLVDSPAPVMPAPPNFGRWTGARLREERWLAWASAQVPAGFSAYLPSALDVPMSTWGLFMEVTRRASTPSTQTVARLPWTATEPGWDLEVWNNGCRLFIRAAGTGATIVSPGITGLGFDTSTPMAIAVRVEPGQVSVAVNGQQVTVSDPLIPASWSGVGAFGATGPADLSNLTRWIGGAVPAWSFLWVLTEIPGGSGWATLAAPAFRLAVWRNLARVSGPMILHETAGTPPLRRPTAVPSSLAAAVTSTIASYAGVAWAQRDGTIRVRTRPALTDPTHAGHYATPVAHLTDEPSPAGSPTPVRRSPLRWSGLRLNEVVNRVRASIVVGGGEAALVGEDLASIDRFGVREETWETDISDAGMAWVQGVLDDLAVARSTPRARLDTVTLDPGIDEAAADLVVQRLELERAVQVTDTHPTLGPTTTTLQVQGETWRMAGRRWTVDLRLGAS